MSDFEITQKGEVIGVGTIIISPSCYLIEVYLVDVLKHNLLSISQLCDTRFDVLFNKIICTISNKEKNITIIGDRVENFYVLNNVDFPTLTCLTAVANDPWIWHRKLGYASMHIIENLLIHELVLGLPKLNESKTQLCNACQLGKQTRSFFKPRTLLAPQNIFNSYIWTFLVPPEL